MIEKMLSEEDKKDIQLMVNAGINIHILNEQKEEWEQKQKQIEENAQWMMVGAFSLVSLFVGFMFGMVVG